MNGSRHGVRVVVYRRAGQCFHLLTTLPDILYPAYRLLKVYNERKRIDVFFKTAKSALHLKNLRTKKLAGIKAFLFLTSMFHNVIKYFMKGAGLARKAGPTATGVGVKAFVEKLACARGWFVRKGGILVMYFTEETPVVRQYLKYDRGPNLLKWI
ncbi:MAG: transposase [Nitrososphaerota archaeon]|nr:transposase [Nitrososphaerota archaeon]MDG7038159.1 transposase [Nitrososphaerota archaeon]